MDLVLPKIETEAVARNYGRFSHWPAGEWLRYHAGQCTAACVVGVLPGAAVTSVRISGIHHEFSVIPYVREDMTAFILNVKELRRASCISNEPARVRAR